MEGSLLLLCGGERGADRRAADPWLAMLRVVAQRSRGSILVQTGPLRVCPSGRVLVVQARQADDPIGPVTAAAVWLGPLTGPEQLAAVRTWLTAGGLPGAPLPAALRPVRFMPFSLPAAALN